MKIGLVLHGPEIIDSGDAKIILEKLSCMGKVEAQLGGTMGRTAVLDAGLEKVIDISRHLKPSICIESLFETSDVACLLNRGKTIETGRVFGKMVASRIKDLEKKPLLHIESPESAFGELIPLNKKAEEYLEKLSKMLELPTKIPKPLLVSTPESASHVHTDKIRPVNYLKHGFDRRQRCTTARGIQSR